MPFSLFGDGRPAVTAALGEPIVTDLGDHDKQPGFGERRHVSLGGTARNA
jgi:hypothetical protein